MQKSNALFTAEQRGAMCALHLFVHKSNKTVKNII